MDFIVKKEVAEAISRNIASKGKRFANVSKKGVDGANTTGASNADALGSSAETIISGYQTMIERDGNDISVLASVFIQADQDMANQVKESFSI